MTALHQATIRGHKEITQFLISKGADIEATDKVSLFVYDCHCISIKFLYIYTTQVVVYCHHIVGST